MHCDASVKSSVTLCRFVTLTLWCLHVMSPMRYGTLLTLPVTLSNYVNYSLRRSYAHVSWHLSTTPPTLCHLRVVNPIHTYALCHLCVVTPTRYLTYALLTPSWHLSLMSPNRYTVTSFRLPEISDPSIFLSVSLPCAHALSQQRKPTPKPTNGALVNTLVRWNWARRRKCLTFDLRGMLR